MSKQVIYVNFYGAKKLEYHNLQAGTIISDISMSDAEISEAEIAQIITRLNETNSDYTFVSDPAGLPEESYSTIYVGKSDAFDEFGAIRGISETTGETAEQTANDKAFVLTQNINSIDELVEVISHETGHLTGDLAHDDNQDGLTIDDFMATYSTPQTVAEGESKTFIGDLFRRNNEYVSQITNNGTLILTGVTCTSNRATQGGALSNYGTATITNSTFRSNYGEYLGGAIYNWGEATLYISNSTFSSNYSINGKAIYNDGTIIIGGLITLDVGQNIFNNATITVDGSKFSFADGAFAKAIDGYEGWCLGQGTVFQGTYNATSGYYVYFNENDGDLYVGNTSMIAVAADSNTTEVTVNGATYQGQYYSTVSAALKSERKTIALSGTTQNARLSISAGITFASSGTLFNGSSSVFNAGALYIKGLGELESVTFNDNSTSRDGGAFYNSTAGRAVINGSAFNGNTASHNGGAIYNERAPLSVGTVTITASTFDKNSAENNGGAVDNAGTATISASTFTDNSSKNGGAITSLDTATITSSSFIGNTAIKKGGAINNEASGGGAGTITISGSTFSKNTAGENGGAICNDASAEITGSTFSGNSAVGYGGAIFSNLSTSLFVANSIFSDNVAGRGGAIFNNGTATISGSTFSGNAGAIYNNRTATISNLTFTGNTGAIYNKDILNIEGLITLTTASDTIYNGSSITVDGAKFDCTQGPVKVVDAFDANWLENGSKDFTVTNGYWLYRDADHIDLLITNQLTTAVVTQDGTYAVTVNGTTYNGPYFSSVEAAFTAGATTVALSGTTRSTPLAVATGKTFAALGTLFEGSSASSDGGAITNSGTAIVSGATFSGNTVASGKSGGAICNRGTMTLENSNFSGNGGYYGGAIYSYNPTELAINGSTFSDNSAVGNGGAIYNSGGILSISNTTFTNSSSVWNGGAVFARSQTTITNSTFLGNSSGKGGAVYNESTLTITGSTFSGNKARTGGAIYNSSGTGSAIIIAGLITLTTASDTIYNAATITVDGTKFDYTNGPALVVDAFDANWLESDSKAFTVTDGYWLFRGVDNIDLYITNQLNTAVVTADGTYAVTVNGTTYNGPYFAGIEAAFAAGATTVAADGIDRTTQLTIEKGKVFAGTNIRFQAPAGSNSSVGMDNQGTATITNSTFSNNTGRDFGGAFVNEGKVTISGSTFEDNSAADAGGAAYISAGSFIVENSSFNRNQAASNGGAIFCVPNATITISDSVFSDNSAGLGGAIQNSGTAIISGSTFENNSATSNGGAILNEGNMTISGSKFEGNSAVYNGGAIDNTGTLSIADTSFLTDADTIFNSGTISLSGKITFAGNVNSYSGVITAHDAEIEFSAAELGGSISASGNSSLTFTNTYLTTVERVQTGFTTIGFAGATVLFGKAQDWSGVNISITNHTVIGGSELSLLVASGEFTLDSANFTVNGVSVTLGNSFTINGTEYLLTYKNTNLILEREFLVINSDGGSDFVSVADLFQAHPDYTGKIKVTGGTFTQDEFFNGNEGVVSNLNSDYSIYGGKAGNTVGDVNLAIADSSINMVFGGSSNGNNGVVKVTFSNSSANYLYATAIGEANGTTLILNNSTVAKEIQGSTLNSFNNQGSTIQMNGGSYGGSDYFFVYTGLKVASAGNVELVYAQYGDSLLTLNNVTLNDKSHLFAGGYGYGAGGAQADAQIIGNTSIEMTGCTINGSVSIYGGGRAGGLGMSFISGNTSISISGITVSAGSTLNIYGGGYNDSTKGLNQINGIATIKVSGTNDIAGKLNIYGGGTGNSAVYNSILVNGTFIQIGTAGTVSNVLLNNVYGGAMHGNVLYNGTNITFAGSGKIAMSGILSGGCANAGLVIGTKTLNFDRFNGTLGAIAVRNFDVVNLDTNSSVVFTNRLDLDTVSAFNFTIDEERTLPDTAILDFAGGITKWSGGLTISVVVGDGGMFDGTTLTLVSALDSLDSWAGKAIKLTTKSGLSDNNWDALIGEDIFDVNSGNTYRFDLVDFDNNGHMDGLQMTMTGANDSALPSALSDMVNSLALDNLSLGSEADLGSAMNWDKQNNGMLA